MLMVNQSDDQLMHLQWKDRTSGTVEDDLILMPDDVEFKAVPACTTGRVFVLKFKGNDKKMFFWMQEPKTDKDEEYCKKVNDFLNNPPAPGSSRSGGGSGGSGSGGMMGGLPGNLDFNNLGDNELQSLLNNMDQRQLMQIFGGSLGGGSNMSSLSSLLGGGSGGGSGGRSRQAAGTGNTRSRGGDSSSNTTSSTPAATVPVPAPAPGGTGGSTATPAIQLSDLQSILSNMQVPAGASGEGGATVDLSTALTGETLGPLLQNQEFLDKVKEFLPAGEEGKEVTLSDLSGTVQSPQFQQAVSMFSMALSSGQLGPLIREFGLGEDAANAAAQGNMEAFVKALQKKEGGEKKEDKDKEEDMALD
eukprot:TRINITY_DN20763_c0_g1_i1.p1 TRINITY_DN20763_c0_g1~~TRINITY_DN20763_c0_g1_i1.p1  ORF type:complete len:361 (-),score=137.53 TRINITY_DN20763_c0_g1_i1:99-1181(-)